MSIFIKKGSPSEWAQISAIYLKVSGAWKKLSNGFIKINGAWKTFFSAAPLLPTQTTAPTIPGGTGKAFTTVTRGSTGSYTSFSSKTHSLIKVVETYTPSSGGTDISNDTTLSTSYSVTQTDATTPQYVFYTRDDVVGLNGTTYYYYSLPLPAYVGDVNDNFNRTTSGGLGTSSSGYIYSSYGNLTSSWSTNGSYAVNASAVGVSDSATSHPLQTVEVGNPNKNYSVDLPDGKGGKGVSFWVTSANSWYAVASYYDYSTATTTVSQCTGSGSGTSCPDTGSNAGDRCGACSSTVTYPCGENGVTYTCSGYDCCTSSLGLQGGDYCNCTNTNVSSTTTILTCSGSTVTSSCPNTGSTVGARCSVCSSTTTCTGSGSSGSCPDIGSNVGDRCGSCSSNSSTTTILTCSGSTVTSSCPNTGSTVGARCSVCSSTTTCTGSGSSGSCPDIGSNVGDRCGVCSSSTSNTISCSGSVSGQSSCPSTGSGVGDRCGPCSGTNSTTYPCTISLTNQSSCPGSTGSLGGDRCSVCTPVASSSTTYGSCRSTLNTPICPSCVGGTTSYAQYNCSTGNWQCRCVISTTTWSYKIRDTVTTTTYSYNVNTSSTTTTYTYPTRQQAYSYSTNAYQDITTTTYTYPTRQQAYSYSTNAYQDITTYTSNYQTRGTVYNYSYSIYESAPATAYYYNTKIKLFSAVSGSVAVQSWDSPYTEGLVTSNYVVGSFDPSQWIGIYNITASSSGNSITATAYDSGGGIIGQTVGKTPSSPTRQNANGETSAGIIKTYSPNNVGTLYDNLSIY